MNKPTKKLVLLGPVFLADEMFVCRFWFRDFDT